MQRIAYDKKGDGKAVKFVLLKGVGKPQIIKLTHQQIQENIN
jgi:3-dehydroquinate synthetase